MTTNKNFIIAPSLLAADAARLGEEAAAVIAAGADMIHLDVMDNHYVPNLTFGPMICKALRDYGISAPIDVHLMVEPVDALITEFAKAGADLITFHPEASRHVDRSISLIKEHGCQAGLAFNPATSLNHCRYVLDKLDLLLIMTVNPGFGGQQFIDSVAVKIAEARELLNVSEADCRLAVDGGVTLKNIAQLSKLGADMFIAGSAIYGASDYVKTLSQFRDALSAK